MKKQPENEYDYITPKYRAYEIVNPLSSNHKLVIMDRKLAYQSNKTNDDHPLEFEIINLQPVKSDDGVKMEKSPAYAGTWFK